MIDYSNHLIDVNATILEAMNALNSMGKNESLTLFVMDEKGCLYGTLTDGDIRRSIVKSSDIQTSVKEVAHCNFRYVKHGDDNIELLHDAKALGISLLPVLNENKQIVDVINLNAQKSLLPIDAVMMAGGKGERLRPLTEKTPKPLLPVGDKAIIDYNVENLISYGVKHINVTVNYLHEQIEEHFTNPIKGVKVETVLEPKFLGTMGSIKFVKTFYNDTILVMNSDLFTNIDYEDFYLHFKQHNADMSVAAIPYKVSIPYGIFDVENRNIQGLIEKPTYTYYANAGIYLFKRSLLDMIPEDTFFNATDFIELLISHGFSVIRYPLNGTWIDIGNPQEYQKANDLVEHLK